MKLMAPSFKLKKSALAGLIFSPSGKLLAQITSRVVVWSPEKRIEAAQFKVISNEHYVAFSPDEKVMAVKNSNGELVFCDPISGEIFSETGRFRLERMGCQPRFSPDGTRLLDGDGNGALIVWDVATATEISRREFGDYMVDDISYCSRTESFAVAINPKVDQRGGSILVTLNSNLVLDKARVIEPVAKALSHDGGWQHIVELAFSPDGAELAIVLSHDVVRMTPATINVVSITELSLKASAAVRSHHQSIWSLSWSVDGFLAAVIHDNVYRQGMTSQEWAALRAVTDTEHVYIYRAVDCSLVQQRPFKGANNAQFSPESRCFAISSSDVPGIFLADFTLQPVFSRVAENVAS